MVLVGLSIRPKEGGRQATPCPKPGEMTEAVQTETLGTRDVIPTFGLRSRGLDCSLAAFFLFRPQEAWKR
jgi:hypothetical protein